MNNSLCFPGEVEEDHPRIAPDPSFHSLKFQVLVVHLISQPGPPALVPPPVVPDRDPVGLEPPGQSPIDLAEGVGRIPPHA